MSNTIRAIWSQRNQFPGSTCRTHQKKHLLNKFFAVQTQRRETGSLDFGPPKRNQHAPRLRGDGCGLLFRYTTGGHQNGQRGPRALHRLCLCNSDDLAGDVFSSEGAVAAAGCLCWTVIGAWFVAGVLCLVVSVARGPVSDSRLWAVELEDWSCFVRSFVCVPARKCVFHWFPECLHPHASWEFG